MSEDRQEVGQGGSGKGKSAYHKSAKTLAASCHHPTFPWESHPWCVSCQLWEGRGAYRGLPCFVRDEPCQFCSSWDKSVYEQYLDAITERCQHPFRFGPGKVWVFFMRTQAPTRVLRYLGIDRLEFTDQESDRWCESFAQDRARSHSTKPLPSREAFLAQLRDAMEATTSSSGSPESWELDECLPSTQSQDSTPLLSPNRDNSQVSEGGDSCIFSPQPVGGQPKSVVIRVPGHTPGSSPPPVDQALQPRSQVGEGATSSHGAKGIRLQDEYSTGQPRSLFVLQGQDELDDQLEQDEQDEECTTQYQPSGVLLVPQGQRSIAPPTTQGGGKVSSTQVRVQNPPSSREKGGFEEVPSSGTCQSEDPQRGRRSRPKSRVLREMSEETSPSPNRGLSKKEKRRRKKEKKSSHSRRHRHHYSDSDSSDDRKDRKRRRKVVSSDSEESAPIPKGRKEVLTSPTQTPSSAATLQGLLDNPNQQVVLTGQDLARILAANLDRSKSLSINN